MTSQGNLFRYECVNKHFTEVRDMDEPEEAIRCSRCDAVAHLLTNTGIPGLGITFLKPGQFMDGNVVRSRCKYCGAVKQNGRCPVSKRDCVRP